VSHPAISPKSNIIVSRISTMKKARPYLFLILLLLVAVMLRRCNSTDNSSDNQKTKERTEDTNREEEKTDNQKSNLDVFRDPSSEFYFTKHARCRMKCRHITQEEVKEIVQKAEVNYKKSELDAAQGPKYALEGVTSRDNQHVRIIVAPKQRHLTIVTVIDLDEEWDCPGCK